MAVRRNHMPRDAETPQTEIACLREQHIRVAWVSRDRKRYLFSVSASDRQCGNGRFECLTEFQPESSRTRGEATSRRRIRGHQRDVGARDAIDTENRSRRERTRQLQTHQYVYFR